MQNRISHSEGSEGMRTLRDACVPMTLTSPPFDKTRYYGGPDWTWSRFTAIADELWRVTMQGGVVVWVVQDSIVGGGESGTADSQKSYFRSLGFLVYQTIYVTADSFRHSSRRYYRQTSLALILSKGRPRSVNPLADRPNSTAGTINRMAHRRRDGSIQRCPEKAVRDYGFRSDAWNVAVGWGKSTKDYYAFEHSALMPESLARDLILSWSRPGDLVLDPMAGAATTCKMALLNHRYYLGFEEQERYFRIAERRLSDAHAEYRQVLDDWLVASTSPGKGLMRPPGGYEVIYADPPWGFTPWGRSPRGRNVQDHYRTMTPEEIKSLPVGELAARDAVLLLWTTGPFLAEAVRTVEAWGFDYKTEGFTWVKTRGGKLFTGLGYHTRANAEFCLLATKGKGLRRGRKDVHQVIISEVMRHSEKPVAVRRRIEGLYGPRRRVELFARTEAPGWDALGDAIDGRDIRDAIGGRFPEPRIQASHLVC